MMRWFAGMGLSIGVAACAAMEMPTPADGATLFAENCAFCHGLDGRGEGEFAASMQPPPSDLTLLADRAGGALPRATVMSQIDGYQRNEDLDEIMPEFGISMSGPTVPFDSGDGRLTPTPYDLVALITYLETIQR